MGITEFLSGYITAFIDKTGYASVYTLMVMESMVLPVPSEAVMPFAGFLIAEGRFTFAGIIAVSTFGSITGSLISYYIGLYGGIPFLDKYGKYLLLDREELEAVQGFFRKRGQITILISRFIPVVRHLISIPAGLAKMNLLKFALFTIIGAGIWNTFLACCGYYLRQNWTAVMRYSRIFDIAVIFVLLAGLAYFIYRHIKKRR